MLFDSLIVVFRILTDFSNNSEIFYTHSPSEPILALGGFHILYNQGDMQRLRDTLDTLSNDLCSSGLVEKGIMGELAARTLLLVARDFSAPVQGSSRDPLVPVQLLDFLHTLFGNKEWAGSNQSKFNTTFRNAYINFTHWIVTKEKMPEAPEE